MRLTNTIRDIVAKKAIDELFSGKERMAQENLRIKCESILIERGDRLASEIPTGWEEYIGTRGEVRIYCQSRSNRHVSLNKQFATKSWSGIKEIHEEDVQAQIDALLAVELEKSSMENDIKRVLNSASTSKQLEDMSPELFRFLPEESQPINALISTAEINRIKLAFEKKPEVA